MVIKVFGSSSKGNCSYVRFENGAELYLDAGVSPSEIDTPKANKWFFVTHEHNDHARYAETLQRKYGAMVSCTPGTGKLLGIDHGFWKPAYPELSPKVGLRLKKEAESAGDGKFFVLPLETVHDAKEPCAFAIFAGKESLFYCTDTGAIPPTHRMLWDVVFIEANYTPKRLEENLSKEDSRGYVAGRVSAGAGHLGLDQVYEWIKDELKYMPMILLGHRSGTNFDEEEYRAMPKDFLTQSKLVESGKKYSLNLLDWA